MFGRELVAREAKLRAEQNQRIERERLRIEKERLLAERQRERERERAEEQERRRIEQLQAQQAVSIASFNDQPTCRLGLGFLHGKA